MGIIPEENDVTYVPPFEELTLMIFGKQGSGKTSFCCGSENTITFACEPGSAFIKTRMVKITNWATFKAGVAEAVKLIQQEKVGGIVIDTIDKLYQKCQDHVCAEAGVEHPQDKKDFGKTFQKVRKEFEKWVTPLMAWGNVRFVAHERGEMIEMEKNGIRSEVNTLSPSFGGKASDWLAGILSGVGWMTRNREGKCVLTFQQTDAVQAKARLRILADLGVIELPDNRDDQQAPMTYIAELYAARAAELGFTIRSRYDHGK